MLRWIRTSLIVKFWTTVEFVVCIGHEGVLGGDFLIKPSGSGCIHLIGRTVWKARGGQSLLKRLKYDASLSLSLF